MRIKDLERLARCVNYLADREIATPVLERIRVSDADEFFCSLNVIKFEVYERDNTSIKGVKWLEQREPVTFG